MGDSSKLAPASAVRVGGEGEPSGVVKLPAATTAD